jgi:hypothetical protein
MLKAVSSFLLQNDYKISTVIKKKTESVPGRKKK